MNGPRTWSVRAFSKPSSIDWQPGRGARSEYMELTFPTKAQAHGFAMIQICSDCDSPESQVPITIPTVDEPNHLEIVIDALPFTGFEIGFAIGALFLLLVGIAMVIQSRERR